MPASPRRSQRIRSAYDGVRLGSVERAAKRKAAASGFDSSSGPARCSGSSRQKKARAAAVAGLLQLPLMDTPSPLTRGKLRQIAQVCDLNAPAILDQVRTRSASSAGVASRTASSSSASSVQVIAPSNE